jgi:hypothetical protein
LENAAHGSSRRIANPTAANPDLWVEEKDLQELYYRTPLNDLSGGYYTSDPQRAFNRHKQRCTRPSASPLALS